MISCAGLQAQALYALLCWAVLPAMSVVVHAPGAGKRQSDMAMLPCSDPHLWLQQHPDCGLMLT